MKEIHQLIILIILLKKINNDMEEMVENNSNNMNQIENTLMELKNELEQNFNDTINHSIEIGAQKDEINNKLAVQMKEQFSKIYDLINGEEQALNDNQIERIKSIQNLLKNLMKNMQNEKIKL